MTRLLMPLCAAMLCTLCGLRLSAGLHRETQRLMRWGTLLAHCRILMASCAYSLPEVFKLAATEQTAADELLRTMAQGLENQRTASPGTLAEQLCPPCPERDAILRLMHAIGHGSLESRLLALDSTKEELALLHQQSRKRAEKDGKLYQTLGWVGGLCLMLLML